MVCKDIILPKKIETGWKNWSFSSNANLDALYIYAHKKTT